MRGVRPESLGGLALLMVADILLRFYLAAALLPIGADRQGTCKTPALRLLLPLAKSTRVVLHYPLAVGMHLLILHLAIVCTGALFMVLPSTLVLWRVIPNPLDSILIMPQALHLQVTYVLTSAATALIGAVVIAFCAVYDARLYMRLRPLNL